jgi:valyl-tRNA synthetase
MKDISVPALEHVLNGDIKLIPEKFINTYKHWMENVHDWCISRQLWWGQRIPAWYNKDGQYVVARTKEEALQEFHTLNEQRKKEGQEAYTTEGLRQDEDVLDTWFSSWLWPISVFDGFKNPDNADIRYYYPTQDLVTAPEILFFWVARMIIAGYEYRGEKPFSNVYLTGIVRDKQGRKMSKSLGNSPDPLDLIEKFGADGVRMGMLICSPSGNDLLFDESLCEQGRNFSNKIWNAFRLIKGWKSAAGEKAGESSRIAVEWFAERLKQQQMVIDDHYEKRRISDALMATYKLIWDDFCSMYLEMVKPEYKDGEALAIDEETLNTSIDYFERLLALLHPFMPFITEEIWHLIRERKEGDDLIISHWPKPASYEEPVISRMERAFACVQEIRNIRSQKGISPKEKLKAYTRYHADDMDLQKVEAVMIKMAGLLSIESGAHEGAGYVSFLVSKSAFQLDLGAFTNADEEKERINKEMDYLRGFLESVNKKLSNERFVQNAKPEVVEIEKRKQSDAQTKLQALEQQLAMLN